MADIKDQQYKRLGFNVFMIVFFGIMLAAGTFADEQIARALYSADDTFVKFVTSTGVYPFFAAAVFFTGVLCQRIIFSKIKKPLKILLCTVCLLALHAISYGLMQIFKNVFHRPRFRLTARGIEGIGFVSWYTPFPQASEFVEKLGIDKGEFRSFPSGHSILSMSIVYILQSLTWFSAKLKDEWFVSGLIGMFFAVLIMFTRMILGAHYLSDVAFGAVISSFMALAYTLIQHRISGLHAGPTDTPEV